EEKKNKEEVAQIVDFSRRVSYSARVVPQSKAVNIGYFYLQYIYQKLKVDEFFDKITEDPKKEVDYKEINRFLTYGRILDPASGMDCLTGFSKFYEKPEIQYHYLPHFMEVLQEKSEDYLEHLLLNSGKIVKRDMSVCLFTCLKVYLENEKDDYVDEVTGERDRDYLYGVSEEHRHAVAEIGIFLDGKGIPISMVVDSESGKGKIPAVPGEKSLIKMIRNKQFICCADPGLKSSHVCLYNRLGGRSYIVPQPVRDTSLVFQKQMFEDRDYRLLSSGEKITLEFMQSFDKKRRRTCTITRTGPIRSSRQRR
ncbi:MAG: transposase, partial [Clostridia bacterium]|nr:transposase [Clostridia bacterium]